MYENLITLETKRLRVVCLEVKDMLLLNQGNNEAQFAVKSGYCIGKVEGIDKELLEEFCHLASENEAGNLWFRLWDIVFLKDNKRIGGALFKGGPNENGEVEIGYGISDEFQGQGFGTEAIQELVLWALRQEGVLSVIAETEKDNIASQKVLQHIGMVNYSETDTDYLWRYQVGSDN